MVGHVLGGLLAAAALTALFNWLLRSYAAPIPRLVLANGLSLFVATVLGAFGFADGAAEPQFQLSFSTYVFPQIVWLIAGLFWVGRKSEASRPPANRTEPELVAPDAVERNSMADNVSEPERSAIRELTPAPARYNNVVAQFWRGEFSLGVSYWVFGFLGGIFIGVVVAVVSTALSSGYGYNPRIVFAVLFMVWGSILLVSIWQLVGIWRSAHHHIERRVREGKRSPWAGLAKVAVVLGLLRVVAEFGQAGVPQLTEATRMAFMNDPDIPAYSFRVMRNGTEAEIIGGFKYGLTADFRKVFRASPRIQVVHLNSLGGRIGEAEKLAKLIQENELSTYVTARCLSACTIAFSAGSARWIRKGATLGFHAPAFPGMSESDLASSLQLQRDIFLSAGFTPEFVNRALATPNAEMWNPSTAELLSGGVITGVSYGGDFAVSGFGAGVQKSQLITEMTKVLPVLELIKIHYPTQHEAIAEALFSGYSEGRTEAEVVGQARDILQPLIAVNRALADDDVLVDLGRLIAAQYMALAEKDPALCYMYASGAGGDRNFSSDLPAELVQRENDLGYRIIATAATRADIPEAREVQLWERVGLGVAERVGVDKLDLLEVATTDPSRYDDYCDVWTAVFQEIVELPQPDAAALMREVFQGTGQ